MRRKVLARLSTEYSARRAAPTGLTRFNPVETQNTPTIRKITAQRQDLPPMMTHARSPSAATGNS